MLLCFSLFSVHSIVCTWQSCCVYKRHVLNRLRDSSRGSVCLFLCLPVNNLSVQSQVIGFMSGTVFTVTKKIHVVLTCKCTMDLMNVIKSSAMTILIKVPWYCHFTGIINYLSVSVRTCRLDGLSKCHMTWAEGAVREMSSVLCDDGSGLLQTCLVFDSGLFLMIKSGLQYSQTLDTPTRSTFYMLFTF